MSDTKFYRIGAAILFSLVPIIIFFMIIGKKSKNKVAKTNEIPKVVSSANVIDDTDKVINISELNEISTVNNQIEKEEIKRNEEDEKKIENEKEDDDVETGAKVEDIVEPVFKYPVEGEIMQEYAKDKLVYSNTLNEWVTHPGVDFKADKTALVKASSAGTIKSIKNDPRYGLTVVIEHVKGYTTVYSNLLTAEFVSVGENVSAGQTIGTVGNEAAFEILDEPHLHFELLKDGEHIDPTMYLKN